jgi:hypothetical protein
MRLCFDCFPTGRAFACVSIYTVGPVVVASNLKVSDKFRTKGLCVCK